MGSGEKFATDIFEWLYIAKTKEEYRSSNTVNYKRPMHNHNDQCTGLDYMKETLSYLAYHGWHNIDSAKVFNLLSATNKR